MPVACAQCLEVSAIDSERMMIHVHRGKGAKDRYVPLPQATLARLRVHWKTHRVWVIHPAGSLGDFPVGQPRFVSH